MKKNIYLYFLVIFYCLLFNDPIENYLKIGILPEVYSFIFFAGALIILRSKRSILLEKNNVKIIALLIIFLIGGICGNINSGYQKNIYLIISALLTVRFIFSYFATRLIFNDLNLFKYKLKFNKQLKILTIFIVLSAIIYKVLNINVVYDSYYERNALKAFFGHSTGLNSFCAILITFLTFFLKSNKENKKYILALLIIMGLTLKSKAFIFIGVYILFMIYFSYRNKTKKKWLISRLTLIIIMGPVLIYCYNVFYIKYFAFTVTYGDTARNILLETSKVLFKKYFPIGTGFGTFASAISGQRYSKLYFDYGIAGTYGMTPSDYSFISDSFWPMILGENGCIGLIIFILIVLIFVKNIMVYKNKKLEVYYFAAYIPIIYLLISSLGESSFAHPLAVGLIFSYTVILNTLKNMLKRE